MPQKDTPQLDQDKNISFQKKVWITTAIITFTISALLLFKATFNVFLLILAGTLIAVFFRGLSDFIQRKTKWKENVCVAISILGTLFIVAGLFWLIGAKVQTQMTDLMETLPKTIENVKIQMNNSIVGEKIIDKLSSKNSTDKVQVFAGQFFQSTFGVFGDIYVILFIAIFFTVAPQTYIKGIVQLIPVKGQDKANDVLDKLNKQLRNWLKGKLFSMFVVFILTAIGLAIIGMPLWLVLALLAGLISFIPNFGPLLALVPAVLVGLMQSPETAALVVGLYVLIQFVESNFITTLVQQKLIDMPPALIIIAQLLMGALTGGWGLILATPIIVILIVLIQELYIKERDN
ncbi:putative PurR-regulated permease PerM [Flavobacterium sp. 7E]|uniref:AI-2E family transporter n=1 Tax=Flavobacterium sp. 7E TaxID=2735898 RepID=UPI00157059C1|nr:AI-2E family transporter [Flavobacterium sp. 7E]NRS89807.1 putative PurR-regulated permease PerM [Flavobacterium sp. 7E]